MFVCIFIPRALVLPLGLIGVLSDMACLISIFFVLNPNNLLPTLLPYLYAVAAISILRILWFSVSFVLYCLGRPQNNRVAFLMCLLASAALLFTLFSLYTPLNADAIGLLILNLVALVIEEVFLMHTRSSAEPTEQVVVGYWREVRVHRNSTPAPSATDVQLALDRLQAQWDILRVKWTEKRLQINMRFTSVPLMFKLVLGVFCDDFSAIDSIARAFDTCPDDLIAFAPQLCVFVLYSPSPLASSLRSLVLQLAAKDVILAHKMMSYLESFSVTPLLYPAVQSLFDDVYNSGVMATIRQQHEHTTSPRVEVNATPGRTLFESHSLFWNRAVWVTRQLAHISTQHERTRELRRQLHEWANEMLVSSNVYVPVGPTHQKVCAVHAEDSFAFSTKARVPILLCLEVIQDSSCRKRTLETSRIDASKVPSRNGNLFDRDAGMINYGSLDEPETKISLAIERKNSDDIEDTIASPMIIFEEKWKQKELRIQANSPYGHMEGWRLVPVIIKSNDDLRQEQICSQVIAVLHAILIESGAQVWLRPYDILALSPDSGVIEVIPDTVSIDCLKKRYPAFTTLRNFYQRYFCSGTTSTIDFALAQENFTRSLAPYSILCFILQIKDRHNGNILVDTEGHLIHIDFGFILGNTPGGNIGFENAPFKLTRNAIELMDGVESAQFQLFRQLCIKTFLVLRQHHNYISLFIEMLSTGNEGLPCFNYNPQKTLNDIRDRFRLDLSDREAIEFVHSLIDDAASNWTTSCYDRYQRYCVGIL